MPILCGPRAEYEDACKRWGLRLHCCAMKARTACAKPVGFMRGIECEELRISTRAGCLRQA